MAWVIWMKRWDAVGYRVALKLYRTAFRMQPELAEITASDNRVYNAACVAALAGEQDQALDWLRKDLAYLESIEGDDSYDGGRLRRSLAHRMVDPDLVSVRDRDDLSEAWREYWTEVEAFLARLKEGAK